MHLEYKNSRRIHCSPVNRKISPAVFLMGGDASNPQSYLAAKFPNSPSLRRPPLGFFARIQPEILTFTPQSAQKCI
jgi:hypothetical protein